jgi:hypothetical protein
VKTGEKLKVKMFLTDDVQRFICLMSPAVMSNQLAFLATCRCTTQYNKHCRHNQTMTNKVTGALLMTASVMSSGERSDASFPLV